MYEDEPQDRVHDVLAEAIYGDHPLGRRVLGRAEVIGGIPVPDIAAYHDARYTADNIVVAAAGHVDHARIVELCRAACSAASAAARPAAPTPTALRAGAASLLREGDRAVPHLFRRSRDRARRRAPLRARDPRHRSSAARFPRGCSARSARSAASPTRSAPTRASTSTAASSRCTSAPAPTTSPRPARSSAASSHRFATRASRADELARAKEHVKGRMVLGLEATGSRMSRLARGDPLRCPAALARRDARARRRGHRRRGRRARRRALRPGQASPPPASAPTRTASRAAAGSVSEALGRLIKVAVSGAAGRMGETVCEAVDGRGGPRAQRSRRPRSSDTELAEVLERRRRGRRVLDPDRPSSTTSAPASTRACTPSSAPPATTPKSCERVAEAGRRERLRRAQLRDRRGADDALRRRGRAAHARGRDHRAPPRPQGRCAVGNREAHRRADHRGRRHRPRADPLGSPTRAGRPPGGHPRRRGPNAYDPPRLDRPALVHARRAARRAGGWASSTIVSPWGWRPCSRSRRSPMTDDRDHQPREHGRDRRRPSSSAPARCRRASSSRPRSPGSRRSTRSSTRSSTSSSRRAAPRPQSPDLPGRAVQGRPVPLQGPRRRLRRPAASPRHAARSRKPTSAPRSTRTWPSASAPPASSSSARPTPPSSASCRRPSRSPTARPATPGTPTTRPAAPSGGSGAAVASGMVPVAHANDGGGSIRIPASINGLVGLKPTRQRISEGPLIGDNMSGLTVELALTHTVRDTAAILDAVQGSAPRRSVRRAGAGAPLRRGARRRADAADRRCRAAAGARARVAPRVRGRRARGARPARRARVTRSRSPRRSSAEMAEALNLEDTFLTRWAAGQAARSRPLRHAARPRAHGRRRRADHLGPGRGGPLALRRPVPARTPACTRPSLGRSPRWHESGYDLLLTPTMAEPPVPLGTYDQSVPDPLDAFRRAVPDGRLHGGLQRHRPAGDLAAAALDRGRPADRRPARRRRSGARTC